MHTSAKIAAWFATAALPFTLYAVDLPNTFSNGTVADADAVNANFSALSDAIDALEANAPATTTTIAFDPSMTTAQMQAAIDDVPKLVPWNVGITFEFADGTYVMDAPLSFSGFYGNGSLNILGTANQPSGPYSGQTAILDFTSVAGNGIQVHRNAVQVIVRHLKVRYNATHPSAHGIDVLNTPTWSLVDYNTVEGIGSAQGGTTGIYSGNGSNTRALDNYVSGGQYGLRAVWMSRMLSRRNDSLGVSPTIGVGTHSSVVLTTDTQPGGVSSAINTASGGVFVTN